jgi:hypothetical protein
MGKAAKQRKRQREVEAAKQVVEETPIAAAFAQDPLAGLISPEVQQYSLHRSFERQLKLESYPFIISCIKQDLATATRVMETFARHPDLYRYMPHMSNIMQ